MGQHEADPRKVDDDFPRCRAVEQARTRVGLTLSEDREATEAYVEDDHEEFLALMYGGNEAAPHLHRQRRSNGQVSVIATFKEHSRRWNQ